MSHVHVFNGEITSLRVMQHTPYLYATILNLLNILFFFLVKNFLTYFLDQFLIMKASVFFELAVMLETLLVMYQC